MESLVGLPFLLMAIFVGLFIVLAILGHLAEKRRREGFLAVAAQYGLRYAARDAGIASEFRFLDALRQGDNRYAFNVLEGAFEGHPVKAFDYHYETHSTDSKGRRQTHHHYFSFFILMQEAESPELRIYPENILSKLGQMIGFEDIDFESAEFSRAFCVRSTDKKFAYDICHARMMEYLLQHRDMSIEIEGRCVALGMNARIDPRFIPTRLRQLVEIRGMFPEYLYRR